MKSRVLVLLLFLTAWMSHAQSCFIKKKCLAATSESGYYELYPKQVQGLRIDVDPDHKDFMPAPTDVTYRPKGTPPKANDSASKPKEASAKPDTVTKFSLTNAQHLMLLNNRAVILLDSTRVFKLDAFSSKVRVLDGPFKDRIVYLGERCLCVVDKNSKNEKKPD